MKRLFERLLASLKNDGRDWTIFALSLLSAFILWFIHNLSLDYSDFIRVQIRASANIQGHASRSSNLCEVTARCRANGYSIMKSNLFGGHSKEITFKATDLHHRAGDTFYLTKDDLNEYSHEIFGEKVTVEYFLVDTLFFRFPLETFKKVPVQAVTSLSFESQHMSRSGLSIEPDSVTIYGEPYHLENVDRVLTKNIRLERLNSGTSGIASIEKIRGIRMSDESVNYSIEVSRFVEMKQEVKIMTKNVPSGKEMMIYPSRASLVIKCAYPMVPDISDVTFYADYEDFENSLSGKCLIKADGLPSGILEYELQPEVVECVLNEI